MPHDLFTGRWRRLLALALGTVLVLAACGGDDSASTPAPTSTIPEVTPAEADAPSPTAEDTAAPVAEQIPGRPDAPAAEDEDFRSDPATLVGATGRPQLVEFFTYW